MCQSVSKGNKMSLNILLDAFLKGGIFGVAGLIVSYVAGSLQLQSCITNLPVAETLVMPVESLQKTCGINPTSWGATGLLVGIVIGLGVTAYRMMKSNT
jgi:hypothetical protein